MAFAIGLPDGITGTGWKADLTCALVDQSADQLGSGPTGQGADGVGRNDQCHHTPSEGRTARLRDTVADKDAAKRLNQNKADDEPHDEPGDATPMGARGIGVGHASV